MTQAPSSFVMVPREVMELADRFETDHKVGCYTLIKNEHATIVAALRAFAQPVAVRHIPTSNSDVAEALTQACEYFENRADVVDGDYGIPEPNTEMRLAQMCADALTVIPVGVDQKRACIESSRAAESAETKSAGGEV